MSELTDILNASIKITRLTSLLVDKSAVAASLTADRQPSRASRLSVEIEGATVSSGSVTITGSTVEAITFDANGSKSGLKDFSSISSIAISGISDGFIKVRAVSRSGQYINQECDVYNPMAVKFYAIDGRIRMLKQGQQDIVKYKFMAAPDKVILPGDMMYALSGVAGITMGQVDFVEAIVDFDGATHHIEAEIKEL